MKIVLLVRSLDVGGTERQVILLAKGLLSKGHDVVVVVFYDNGVLQKELKESGVSVHNLHKSGRWDSLLFFFRLIGSIRLLRPEIIYGFLSTPNILSVLLKPFFPKIKIIWGVRSSLVDFDRYNWLLRLVYRIERSLSGFPNLIICNSQAGLDNAALHGFPKKKMIVIPNGIDIDNFKPNKNARNRIRAEFGIPEEEIIIGLIARFDPMKDHSNFIRAAALLSNSREDVHFMLVGDGSENYKNELYELSTKLKIANRLIWLGERSDVPDVINALDINCSSSYSEGFSNSIVEAMSCGIPCVVTDVGDSAIIVGRYGEVVLPNNSVELYEGMVRMIRRLNLDLSNSVRKSIIERYSIENMLNLTLNYIKNFLNINR